MGTRPRKRHACSIRTAKNSEPSSTTISEVASLQSMDSVVVSTRTSAPCCCCCPQQQQRSKIVGVCDDEGDCGRRNSSSSNAIINTRTECHNESAMASVSASVAIEAEEEEEEETSNYFNYWRVLNSISSIMFDNNHHTHKMMTGSSSCRHQQHQRGRGDRSNQRYYTLTEVQTHNTLESAWITCGNTIYDVTPYITNHPGGSSSILNKSGGVVDCTRDLHFHSKRAQREWKRYKVGILLT
jgi:cytochrome b involved in lipid metabolism